MTAGAESGTGLTLTGSGRLAGGTTVTMQALQI